MHTGIATADAAPAGVVAEHGGTDLDGPGPNPVRKVREFAARPGSHAQIEGIAVTWKHRPR